MIAAYERLQEAVGGSRQPALCRRLARLAVAFEDPGGAPAERFDRTDLHAAASSRMLDMAKQLATEAEAIANHLRDEQPKVAMAISLRALELEKLTEELRKRVEVVEAIGGGRQRDA